MKGIIFTEFLTMVEQAHGLDMVDTIIEKSDLPSKGAYTTVGTYHHTEIVALVTNLGEETSTDLDTLLYTFGVYLFSSLAKAHPEFVDITTEPLDFLEQVETYIHVEVRKLYPEADLPTFRCSRPDARNQLHMLYISNKHMEDVCEGLIVGCMQHFGADHTIKREQTDEGELFIITCNE